MGHSVRNFFGVQETRLDAQFRVPLPKDLSDTMTKADEGVRVVPDPNGRYVDIFLASGFEAFFERFVNSPGMGPAERNAAIDGYFSRAEPVDKDHANRLTLPKSCRGIFKGEKKVVLQGRGPMLRLMTLKRWQEIDAESRQRALALLEVIEESAFEQEHNAADANPQELI